MFVKQNNSNFQKFRRDKLSDKLLSESLSRRNFLVINVYYSVYSVFYSTILALSSSRFAYSLTERSVGILNSCIIIFYHSVPWLIPILQVEEVAQDIVDAVRENQDVIVFPSVLGMVLALKR